MRASVSKRFVLSLSLLFALAPCGLAASVVSSMRQVNAVMQSRGFHIVPVGESPARMGDLAPVQSFEIVRPNGEKVTIGRLYTSCVCVTLESPQRTFERGERAILDLHNVKATPPEGQRYAIYVQVTSPIRSTLRFDTFVRSSQFIPAAPAAPATAASGGSTSTAATEAERVGPDDDLEPVMTYLPDPHAEPAEKVAEAEEPEESTEPTQTEEESVVLEESAEIEEAEAIEVSDAIEEEEADEIEEPAIIEELDEIEESAEADETVSRIPAAVEVAEAEAEHDKYSLVEPTDNIAAEVDSDNAEPDVDPVDPDDDIEIADDIDTADDIDITDDIDVDDHIDIDDDLDIDAGNVDENNG